MRVPAAFVFLFAAMNAAHAQVPCKLTPVGSGTVAAVRDGRSIMLTDGRELRLAAIEADDNDSALRALAPAGTVLTLARQTEERDRYGRVLVFATPAGGGPSLQEALLAQGAARVSPRAGEKSCAAALLALENTARTKKTGLWADPNFAPLPADNLTGPGVETGRFVLVEGKVLSVRESGSTVYVNFGRRWTRDFSFSMPKRLQKAFAAEGLEPKTLEGRRVRLRGWLEQRRGPMIDVTMPGQIERVD